MEKLNTFFDESEVGQTILQGTFPMHVIKVDVGEAVKGSIPYNLTFKIAKEAGKFKGSNPKTGEEELAEGMVGREVRSIGVWLNPNPGPGESWRNNRYVALIEATGITLEEVNQNGKKVKQLVKVEELDLLGKPILGEIKPEVDKRDKDKPAVEQRSYQKVHGFFPWVDGKSLPTEELIEDPFADFK